MFKSSIVLLFTLLSSFAVSRTGKRHTIYWDAEFMPKLKSEVNIEVYVNEWMDQLCPRKTGHNATTSDVPSYHLDVYNVTKEHYDHCIVRGHKKVLRCKDPRQEIKLTTKFQTRSPSPIGFVFRPGSTYYYIAKPTRSDLQGCSGDTMRMSITVKKRDSKTQDNHRQKSESSKDAFRRLQGTDMAVPTRHHHHDKNSLEDKKKNRVPVADNSPDAQASIDVSLSSGENKPTNSVRSALASQTCWQINSLFVFVNFILGLLIIETV